MSDKKRKVPKLRFPGFTDDWEQRKLGEVVTFFAGLTYSPDNVQSSGTLVLRSSNVKNGEIVDADNVYVNHNVVNSDNVQVGDIIVVVRNGSRDLIGKHAQVKKQMEDTVIGAFMTGIRTKKPEFMNAMLDTSRFEAEVAKNLGATINQITGRVFSEMSFSMPETKEQAVIGTFFRNLDSLISLHQRKLDNVKMLKKSLLQKLFPKDGEKTPEVRFPGFTDDWEQRKLDSVLLVSTEKNIRNEYSRNEVLSVSREAGTVNQIEYQGRSFAGEDLSGYKVVREGELIYTKSPLRGAPYGIFQVATIRGILSPLYAVYKSSHLALAAFVATYLKNDSVATKYLAPLVTKGAKNTINVTDEGALKGKILIPQVAEQQRIYSLFAKIDGLLSLHQRKLDHLKELKKGLLQQMFV